MVRMLFLHRVVHDVTSHWHYFRPDCAAPSHLIRGIWSGQGTGYSQHIPNQHSTVRHKPPTRKDGNHAIPAQGVVRPPQGYRGSPRRRLRQLLRRELSLDRGMGADLVGARGADRAPYVLCKFVYWFGTNWRKVERWHQKYMLRAKTGDKPTERWVIRSPDVAL